MWQTKSLGVERKRKEREKGCEDRVQGISVQGTKKCRPGGTKRKGKEREKGGDDRVQFRGQRSGRNKNRRGEERKFRKEARTAFRGVSIRSTLRGHLPTDTL